MACTVQAFIAINNEHSYLKHIWADNIGASPKHIGVRMKSHHTAVSARVSQRQSELSGPARVHAELQAQSLATCSWKAQGSYPGVRHGNADRH